MTPTETNETEALAEYRGEFDFVMDVDDDEPIVCGVENPDVCDSCQ